MNDRNTIATTPEERRLIGRLYGPDPREEGRQPEDQRSDSAFVFDIEDMALVGRPSVAASIASADCRFSAKLEDPMRLSERYAFA